jgi:hypothetical protein
MFSYVDLGSIPLPNLEFNYPGSPKTTMRRVKRCLLHQHWFRERIVGGEDEEFILDKCSNIFILEICSDNTSIPSLS